LSEKEVPIVTTYHGIVHLPFTLLNECAAKVTDSLTHTLLPTVHVLVLVPQRLTGVMRPNGGDSSEVHSWPVHAAHFVLSTVAVPVLLASSVLSDS